MSRTTPTTKLGAMMKLYRVVGDRNMRGLGKEMGVSAATWMRLEHGFAPEADTLVKLLAWMLKPEAPR